MLSEPFLGSHRIVKQSHIENVPMNTPVDICTWLGIRRDSVDFYSI